MAFTCIADTQVAPLLQAEEIHVWTITVADWLPHLAILAETLNSAERERAARFRFEKDRRRFTLCRGLLRSQLGNYLSVVPGEIEFRFGAQDKPELASSDSPRIEFNLSHSDEAAFFAFAAGQRLGVDIEKIRPGADVHGLGSHVFSAPELAKLSAASEPEKLDLFFAMWTQKEAYIKAVGLGLVAPVRDITVGEGLVPQGDGNGVGLIEGYGTQWSLVSLAAPAGYKAALAVEGQIRSDRLRLRPLLPQSGSAI